MNFDRGTSSYLKRGRLADVIAAVQIMGAGERPERDMARELSYRDSVGQMFLMSPELFLVYHLHDDPTPKAALRWRYTNKLYDSRTGKEYTPQERDDLPEKEPWKLTTRPLSSDAIAALMKTAIELHSRAIEELTA